MSWTGPFILRKEIFMGNKKIRSRASHYLKCSFRNKGLPIFNESNKNELYSFESRLKGKKYSTDLLAIHDAARGVVDVGLYYDYVPLRKRHDVQALIDDYNAKHKSYFFKICPDYHVLYLEGTVKAVGKANEDRKSIYRLLSNLISEGLLLYPSIRKAVIEMSG